MAVQRLPPPAQLMEPLGELALRIHLTTVTLDQIDQVRRLNAVLFPVRYGDRYYQRVLEPKNYAKLAYVNKLCAGTISCDYQVMPHGSYQLYVMTLGVLAPYRHLGIGSALLTSALDWAYRHNSAALHLDGMIVQICLHVQVSNNAALAFYRRHGFTIHQLIPNYYQRIESRDAYLLVKALI